MSKQPIRGRSDISGFAVTRVGTGRRVLERLRPEGGFIPIGLDLLDIVAELDPGMVDWQNHPAGPTPVGVTVS